MPLAHISFGCPDEVSVLLRLSTPLASAIDENNRTVPKPGISSLSHGKTHTRSRWGRAAAAGGQERKTVGSKRENRTLLADSKRLRTRRTGLVRSPRNCVVMTIWFCVSVWFCSRSVSDFTGRGLNMKAKPFRCPHGYLQSTAAFFFSFLCFHLGLSHNLRKNKILTARALTVV